MAARVALILSGELGDNGRGWKDASGGPSLRRGDGQLQSFPERDRRVERKDRGICYRPKARGIQVIDKQYLSIYRHVKSPVEPSREHSS